MPESGAQNLSRDALLREIEALVRVVLEDPAVSLREEMYFEEAGPWDSLVQTQVVVAIERRFSVLFDLEELASISTVGALVDTLGKKLTAQ